MLKLLILKNKGLLSFVLLFAITLTANQIAFSQFVCQPSGTPVTTTSSLTVSDPTQAGRVVRDGIPSSCTGKTNSLQNSTVVHAKAFPFTAPVTGCATVDFNHLGCGVNTTESVAYSTYNPASPATGVIGDSGFSSTGTGSYSFPVTSGQAFTIVVHEIAANTGCASFSFTISYSTNCRQAGFDRTNDGKADITLWRPSDGNWFTVNADRSVTFAQFGQVGDITTAGDYTGDGQTDLSVYRPGNNFWYYGLSQTTPSTNFFGLNFGVTNDIPVPGDYDRDGKTDIALWRPSNGFWYVLRSSSNTLQTQQWGQSGDIPVVGDFDGDRINDFGIVRPNDSSTGGASNRWYVLESNFGFGFFLSFPFGNSNDKLVPADYDGDGKTDIAIWRPSDGNWFVLQSSTNTQIIKQFGQSGDVPQPADYDGDKKADFAVYRPSATQSVWFINNSSGGTFTSTVLPFGGATDQPATTAYKVQ